MEIYQIHHATGLYTYVHICPTTHHIVWSDGTRWLILIVLYSPESSGLFSVQVNRYSTYEGSVMRYSLEDSELIPSTGHKVMGLYYLVHSTQQVVGLFLVQTRVIVVLFPGH